MPDCPNCGTWNPDDKTVCWRCQAELPRPQPRTKRQVKRIGGLPVWTWVILALFVVVWTVSQCYMFGGNLSR